VRCVRNPPKKKFCSNCASGTRYRPIERLIALIKNSTEDYVIVCLEIRHRWNCALGTPVMEDSFWILCRSIFLWHLYQKSKKAHLDQNLSFKKIQIKREKIGIRKEDSGVEIE